jgi:S1-C subfamily serine protease
MTGLGNAYQQVGRLADALALHQEAVKRSKAKLGPDHPTTLQAMQYLAWAYQSAGRLADALPLAEQTLKLSKAKFGLDHPTTLQAMIILAAFYCQSAGRLAEALPLAEETVKLSKAKLGPDNPITLQAMIILAYAYKSAGRLTDAVPLFEETLKRSKAKLGPDNPITLMAMQSHKHPPAEIAAVEAGSAAWQKGIPSGSLILKIDNVEHPYFDDLLPKVMHSRAGEKLTLVYQARSQPPKTIEIEPRRRKGDSMPLIGISPPDELELKDNKSRKAGLPPVLVQSAANQASPAFAFSDAILATTDPDHPDTIKPLPPNPFAPDRKDYYEFYKRLVRLEGQPMIIRVRRAKADPQSPPVDIQVPRSYHYTFGMRMRMGQITAVRDGSEAAKGLVPGNAATKTKGDIIQQVEVVDASGHTIRFVTARGKTPANDNVKEVDVDPMLLVFTLQSWAQQRKGEKTVALSVFRGEEHKEVTVTVPWDESRRFDREVHISRSSPMSIPELGLAYQVECMVDEVKAGSPAAKAGLKGHDVIKAVRFQDWDADQRQAVPGSQWYELEVDQWAWCFAALQRDDFKTVTFRVKRDKQGIEITVAAQPDPTWPQAERGLLLIPDLRLLKARTS